MVDMRRDMIEQIGTEMPHYLFTRKCIYDCGGFKTSVYQFFVRMPQKPD
jgi:hypothetical protein